MQWHQVLTNPALKNLPFKIELDFLGQLLMSPASNAHGEIQADPAAMLKGKFKQRGRVFSELRRRRASLSGARKLLAKP